MPLITELETKIDLLFKKFDSLSDKFAENDKWMSSKIAEIQNEMSHIKKDLESLHDEQRVQEKESHINSESVSEEIHKFKEDLWKEDIDFTKRTEEAKKELEKSCNDYTNRVFVGFFAVISVITAIIAIIKFAQGG